MDIGINMIVALGRFPRAHRLRLAFLLAVSLAVAPAGVMAGVARVSRDWVLASWDPGDHDPEKPGEHEQEHLDVAEQADVQETSEIADSDRDAIADEGGRGGEGPLEIAHDPLDRAFRAGELVIVAAASETRAIASLGAPIIERRPLRGLGDQLLRVALPLSVNPAVYEKELAFAAPSAVFDLDHVYRLAGDGGAVPGGTRTAFRADHGAGIVGVVDSPVDRSRAAAGFGVIESRSFAPNPPKSVDHGTAVAYLASRGGARLLAANVFTRDPSGGAVASVDAMARAMDWLVTRGVSVINLSLEGPPNRVLADLVRRAQARGCVVVAAAGNGGPAAPPAYPAAYPSVVAVTAVDASGAVYSYANRGSYIMFAALGVGVRTPGSQQPMSGTSYAAPVVAGMIARRLPRQDRQAAAAVVEALKRQARRLGPADRDPIYGYGVLEN